MISWIKTNRIYLILAAILLLALFLRLYHINQPYLDHHSWRQTDTATIAQNFYYNGFNILSPELNTHGNESSVVELELQITPFLTALLYPIFGVQDWVGRVIPIIFSLLSIIFFYKITKLYFDEKLALFSTFIFSILPLNVFFSRVLMPESGMIFLLLAGLYYFSKFNKTDENKDFILALVFITFTFLSKLSTLYLLIPLSFIAFNRYGIKAFLNKKILLLFSIPLLITFMYYFYIHQTADIKLIPYRPGTDKWGSINIWFNVDFYKTLFIRLETIIFTQLGYLLFLIGIVIGFLETRAKFFYFWLLAVILYIFIIANGNFIHSYYQLPLLVVGSFFIGLVLYKIYQKKHFKLIAFGLAAFILYLSINNGQPLYRLYAISAFEAAEKLKEIDQQDSLVLSVLHRQDIRPELLYYANRKGWVIWPDQLSIETLEYYKNQGVKYIVMTQPFYLSALDINLQNYLRNHKIYQADSFVIFEKL